MTRDLEAEVRSRAGQCCEYCHLPQPAFKRSFHIEHIVARQHGGRTHPNNLALACWYCNLKKGPNLSGIDPVTRQLVPLFNPREHRWPEHFQARIDEKLPATGLTLVGLTATGRATIQVLDMNEPFRCELRLALAREGLYATQATV